MNSKKFYVKYHYRFLCEKITSRKDFVSPNFLFFLGENDKKRFQPNFHCRNLFTYNRNTNAKV